MLISHRYKYIYLKTVKTAGTSVEIYFERFCVDPAASYKERHFREPAISKLGVVGYRGPNINGQTWYNHMPAKRVSELLGQELWSKYFKFCVVRNPFDKVVSWFWFQLEDPDRKELGRAPFPIVRKAFVSWARNAHFPRDRRVFMIDGEPVADCFIRYETLAQGMRKVCRKLKLPWEPARLGKYKTDFRVRNEPFSMYYDARTESAVRQTYDWELEYFGYDLKRAPRRGAGRKPRSA